MCASARFATFGAALFLALVAFAFLCTEGDFFGGVIRDKTPANHIFVGLTQVLLVAWLAAGLLAIFERDPRLRRAVFEDHDENPRTRHHPSDDLQPRSTSPPSSPHAFAPVTSAEVAVCAAAGTVAVTAFVTLYSSLCWDFSRDRGDHCAGIAGGYFSGSPVVIEFSACIALFALFASPWPLPAWRARVGLARLALECLVHAIRPPGCQPRRRSRDDDDADVPVSIPTGYVPLPDRATSSARCSRTVRGRFSAVRFRHALFADVLTSAGLMLWQSEFTLCLFATSSWTAAEAQKRQGAQCAGRTPNALYAKPFAIALPFWVRLSQCFGSAREDAAAGNRTRAHMHAANALKYAACLGVVATSACVDLARVAVETGRGPARFAGVDAETWKQAWLVVTCGKTAFCYWWDCAVDWGLLRIRLNGATARSPGSMDDELDASGDKRECGSESETSRAPLLRRRLWFRPRWGYHLAMALNLVGRVSWSLAISPHWCQGGCAMSLGLVELARRGMWTALRVEREAMRIAASEDESTRRTLAPADEDDDEREGENERRGSVDARTPTRR